MGTGQAKPKAPTAGILSSSILSLTSWMVLELSTVVEILEQQAERQVLGLSDNLLAVSLHSAAVGLFLYIRVGVVLPQ